MLYIYSGHVPELDEHLSHMLGKNGLITVIPASPDDRDTALAITSYFESINIRAQALSKRACLVKNALENQILASSAVYLCGGNTYDFLNFARNMDLFSILTILEENGGIIAGESAGSIILSSDISTAAIPRSCPDENTINLSTFEAMGRIPFHISPHFDEKDSSCEADINELQVLANESNKPVLLLEDGEGFIMQDQDIIQFIGIEKFLTPVMSGTSSSSADKVKESPSLL